MLASETGPEILPIAEIEFVDFPGHYPRIVDYAAKWDSRSLVYQNTRRIFPDPVRERQLLDGLAELALRCWDTFALNGYARIDLRVDGQARPWVLEVNANPCLAPDAGFAAAAGRRGLTITDVIARILKDCCALPHASAVNS